MGRAGYTDDCYNDADTLLAFGRWRAQVNSTIRGKRGQAFLRELLAALDAMPEKRLIANDLVRDGNVCAIGSVGLQRGIDMGKLDPEDYDSISGTFGITHQLVREIEWMNDEGNWAATPEARWQFMRNWVAGLIRDGAPNA